MSRNRYTWKLRDREVLLGDRTLIMGILNVTPDSFSDGGKYDDPGAAAERAIQLQEMGANIIDIGAESTRPGSTRISGAEELRRLIPVLKRISGKVDIPISIDTYKPEVAEVALDNGAQIINDPSGLTWEPELAKVVMYHNAGLILNHTRGTPDTWAKQPPIHDVLGTIRSELEASFNRARHAGVEKERIVIDPGLGFGKRLEQNAEIIARLRELESLLLPVAIGPSRKSFLAVKDDESATDMATGAAVALSIAGGAHIVRIHDVKGMRSAVQVSDAVATSRPRSASSDREAKKRAPAASPGTIHGPDLDDEKRRRPIAPPRIKKEEQPVPRPQQEADGPPGIRRPPRFEGPPAKRAGPRPFSRPAPFRDREDRPPRSGDNRERGSKFGRPAGPGGPQRGPGGPPRRGPGGPPRPGGAGGRPPRPGGGGGRPPRPGGGGPPRPGSGGRPPKRDR